MTEPGELGALQELGELRAVTALVDGVGFALGIVARHGAAVVELESTRSLRPTRALHLGEAPADAPPALARIGGRLVAAWVDLDGAHVAFVGERGRRIADAAHAIALATTGSELWVAVAGDALVLHRFDRELLPRGAPELVLERRDARHLALCETGDDVLLLHTLADPVLVVHRLDRSLDARGAIRRDEVRHPIASVPRTSSIAGVPGTVALALDDGAGHVSFATFDRRGRTKERLHVVHGVRTSPSVCWLDDGFALGTLEVERGRFELVRADGKVVVGRDGIELAPWVARHQAQRVLLFAAGRDGDREALVLHAIGREGDAQRHVIDVTPSDAAERARRAAIRSALRQVVELAPTIGYRGATRARREGALAVEVRFDASPARVAIVERGEQLELVLSAGATILPEVPEPTRGVRALFRRVPAWARELVKAELGEEHAAAAEVVDAALVEGAAWMRVRLGASTPSARSIVQWLRALVERVS